MQESNGVCGTLRLEGPNIEAQRAREREFLRRGQPDSSPPVRWSGKGCELPQRSLTRAPAATWFAYILRTSDGLW